MTPMDRKLLGAALFIGVPVLLILFLSIMDFAGPPSTVLKPGDLIRDLLILVMVGGWLIYVLSQVICRLAYGDCNLKQKLVIVAGVVFTALRWVFLPTRGYLHGGTENEFTDWARALFHTVGIVVVSSLLFFLFSSQTRRWFKRHRA